MGSQLMEFRCGSAIWLPTDAGLSMATAGAAKSPQAHRHSAKQRRHLMKPPVFDATRMTARRAIRAPNCMVVCLDGDHHVLQAREDLLRLGQCQPQLRDVAEVTKRSDIHYVDDPRRAVDPGFDQAQDPPHPRIPSQQTIGQSYRLRPHTPTFWALPTNDEFARDIVRNTAKQFGALDFVWNNVGAPGPASIEGFD
jgi:hypothetical protein